MKRLAHLAGQRNPASFTLAPDLTKLARLTDAVERLAPVARWPFEAMRQSANP